MSNWEDQVVWSIPASDIPDINDLELIHWPDDTFSVRVETIYYFTEEKHAAAYFCGLLEAFTKWMEEQGRDTNVPVDVYPIFNKDSCRFNTIEEAYAFFRAMVTGIYDLGHRKKMAESLFGILPADADLNKKDDPE